MPTSVHSDCPLLFLSMRYTFVRTSYLVSSSSSPSPSTSCTELCATRGGVSSAGVSALDELVLSPASAASADLASAVGGAPNEKPPNLDVDAAGLGSASGVFGGLPKPKPTGLPMLPAALNVNGVDLGGGVLVLKLKAPLPFVGVEVNGVSLSVPNARPPPNVLPAVEGLSASLFSSMLFEPSVAGVVKRLLEKIDGVAADEGSVSLLDGKAKEVEDDEDGPPNVKADLSGAAEELLPEAAEGEPNAKEDDLVRSKEGLNPPAVLVEDDGAAGGMNPVKFVGGAGIAGGGLSAGFDGAKGFAPKLNGVLGATGGASVVGVALDPNVKPDVVLDGAAAGVDDGEIFLTSCSYSSLTFDRKDLYCSSTVARSRNGSESTALVIAFTNDTLRPRRER